RLLGELGASVYRRPPTRRPPPAPWTTKARPHFHHTGCRISGINDCWRIPAGGRWARSWARWGALGRRIPGLQTPETNSPTVSANGQKPTLRLAGWLTPWWVTWPCAFGHGNRNRCAFRESGSPDVWRHETGERPGNRGSRHVEAREAGLRFSSRNANSRREGRHPSLPNKFPLRRDRGRGVTALLVGLFACDRGLRRDKSGGQGANILRGAECPPPPTPPPPHPNAPPPPPPATLTRRPPPP